MIHSDTTSGNNSDNPRETLEEGSREKETILVMIGRHSVGKAIFNVCFGINVTTAMRNSLTVYGGRGSMDYLNIEWKWS